MEWLCKTVCVRQCVCVVWIGSVGGTSECGVGGEGGSHATGKTHAGGGWGGGGGRHTIGVCHDDPSSRPPLTFILAGGTLMRTTVPAAQFGGQVTVTVRSLLTRALNLSPGFTPVGIVTWSACMHHHPESSES